MPSIELYTIKVQHEKSARSFKIISGFMTEISNKYPSQKAK